MQAKWLAGYSQRQMQRILASQAVSGLSRGSGHSHTGEAPNGPEIASDRKFGQVIQFPVRGKETDHGEHA